MTLLFHSYDSGPFLSGEIPLPSRPPLSLPGDTFADGVLTRGFHRGLVGVVDFRNRVSMGRSNNGVPLYLFHPFHAGYPPFLVGSKTKSADNLICTVDFVSWEGSWPRGALQERLGPVGAPDVERAACIRAATVGKLSDEGCCAPDLASYKADDWDAVFHIDPEGCEDVDDVLAYKVTPTGVTWLIGIADVAAFVKEGSPMDQVAALRAQTLYDDGVVVAPMLPPAVSTGLASLRSDGVARPVLGLVLHEDGRRTLEFHRVVVTQSYTYESVLSHAEICDRVASLSAALGRVSSDPHEWIEGAMIAYNAHVARLLRSAGIGLLRRQLASEAPAYAEIAKTSGCAEIAHLGAAAGEYCAATESEVSHAGLSLPEYCHASSPLRRYADLANQRCLHALLRGDPNPGPVSIAYLNHRALGGRRMERDLWFLRHAPTGAISESKGLLLTATSAYSPEWKRVLKVVVEDSSCIPGTPVTLRVYIDPASPRRRVICSANVAPL
jgi:hypothetical protein